MGIISDAFSVLLELNLRLSNAVFHEGHFARPLKINLRRLREFQCLPCHIFMQINNLFHQEISSFYGSRWFICVQDSFPFVQSSVQAKSSRRRSVRYSLIFFSSMHMFPKHVHYYGVIFTHDVFQSKFCANFSVLLCYLSVSPSFHIYSYSIK